MKSNEAKLFIFIACISIGVLISMNISFKKVDHRNFLNIKQYQDAYTEKKKLSSDISNLIKKYNQYLKKVDKYIKGNKDDDEIVEEVKKEINNNELDLGNIRVKGQGIKITMKDGDKKLFSKVTDPSEQMGLIIHDKDILYVINDLKNAGAEAISINGQRITSDSSVYCDGPFLSINGVKIVSPFYISAIGNKETLREYMLRSDGYLQILKLRRTNVDLTRVNEVEIPAYQGDIYSKYLKSDD
ncbi:DUF881 domain-containing protein [Clostridium oceanicum]